MATSTLATDTGSLLLIQFGCFTFTVTLFLPFRSFMFSCDQCGTLLIGVITISALSPSDPSYKYSTSKMALYLSCIMGFAESMLIFSGHFNNVLQPENINDIKKMNNIFFIIIF